VSSGTTAGRTMQCSRRGPARRTADRNVLGFQSTGFPDPRRPTLSDASVVGCKRDAMRASGSDDQTIGRVSMERSRKTVEGDHDLDIQRRDFDYGGTRGLADPDIERPVQHETSLRIEHLCLPEAHRCQAEPRTRRQSIEHTTLAVRKLFGAEQPPDPNVCVQQNLQRDASRSASSITDSSGLAFSSPEPRRASHGLAVASPAFGAGESRATTLPRRLMSTGSPSASTRRINSRQLARN
jgi:hypothetical protein